MPKRKGSPGNQTTPKNNHQTPENVRSSGRLKEKSQRKFHMPTRDEVWDEIPEDDSPENFKRKPRMRVNNLTRVSHGYNQDKLETFYTSSEGSLEEFIDDDEADYIPRKKTKHKISGRKRCSSRLTEASSGSSSDEDVPTVSSSNKKAQRIDSGSSESDEGDPKGADASRLVSSDSESDRVNKSSTKVKAKKTLSFNESDSEEDSDNDIPLGAICDRNNIGKSEDNNQNENEAGPEGVAELGDQSQCLDSGRGDSDSALSNPPETSSPVYFAKPQSGTDEGQTGLFNIVEGTDQDHSQKAVIISDDSDAECSDIALALVEADSSSDEAENDLMSPRQRVMADRKMALKQWFQEYKAARKQSSEHAARKGKS